MVDFSKEEGVWLNGFFVLSSSLLPFLHQGLPWVGNKSQRTDLANGLRAEALVVLTGFGLASFALLPLSMRTGDIWGRPETNLQPEGNECRLRNTTQQPKAMN